MDKQHHKIDNLNMYSSEGLRDTVEFPVEFIPWYTDTSFLLKAHPPSMPKPSAFRLACYPNPFNNTVRIRLYAPEAVIARLELFDLLGRRVREVFHGPVIYDREFVVDAAGLISGVYFARATDALMNRPLSTQKLILLR